MARSRALACLVGLCLLAGCTAELTKESVQEFVNEVSNTVTAVKLVAPAEASAMLEQIAMSVNSIAAAWWEIDWAAQQSQWDTLVMAANTVVQQVQQIATLLPESSGNSWGSMYPQDEMYLAASEICNQIASMKSYAEQTYGVLLTITNMSGCLTLPGTVSASPMSAPVPAPAPGPTVSRRMLAA
ncbi:peptidase M32 [Micractinium conductrix]|uniref:Peptidase M32 n=1 Tax=Micractinium conductrix TaxID=554055 RepID=A0A2P6VHI4_9CHLO|nr:peptidase M32 [Micractinium conductrix]|eukprot:PSC73545.1 peptidase M32 [Micractinium conductrix]